MRLPAEPVETFVPVAPSRIRTEGREERTPSAQSRSTSPPQECGIGLDLEHSPRFAGAVARVLARPDQPADAERKTLDEETDQPDQVEHERGRPSLPGADEVEVGLQRRPSAPRSGQSARRTAMDDRGRR